MFRGSPSILTLIATLAHSVLGCCWHHAHAHEFGSDCANSHHAAQIGESVNPPQSRAVLHDHCQPSRQAPEGDDHDHGNRCDGSRCEYLKTPAVVMAELCVTPADGLPANDVHAPVVGPLSRGCDAFLTRPSLAAQPLRAETQVWLL